MMVKLGDVIEQIRGVSYKPSDLMDNLCDCSVTLLRANNIKDGKIILDDVIYVSKSKVNEKQYLKKGDILVCTSSGSKDLVGKAAFINEDLNMVFGAFCKVVRIKNQYPEYIGHFFQSPYYRTRISQSSAGANINNIKNENIDNLLIPLPPLEEQRKIAETLDKVSDLINKRKQQLEKLDLLVKSKFVEMFGDLKLNPMNWSVEPFHIFAKFDCNMTTDYEKYADYPHIGIDSIEKETGKLIGYRTVKEDGVISGKYIFTPEHIIYSKIRPNLNKVALPEFYGLCSADAYPILVNNQNCNRYFLAITMRSKYFLDYILQFCNRTNLPKVNKKEISGFKMPLPPIELQNQFADFVKQTKKTKTIINQSLDKLETLKKALMQEYFG